MLENPYRCVVDSDGYYVEFVTMQWNEDPPGELRTEPYVYKMKVGETLIEASKPDKMIKPHWTGSDWQETGTKPPLTPEEVEQLREEKLQKVNAAAQQAIYAGVTVGEHTFALTEVDQINITTLAAQLGTALKGEPSSVDPAKGVPYHADGELCRYWRPEEFAAITQAATYHVFYHQTYCNHLRQYIKGITDPAELEAVQYGMELPPALTASMAALMGGDGK